MRWKPDSIDMMCDRWAIQRRKILGIILPEKLEPRERLGKLRSTLGQVREEAEGAGQSGVFSQDFPEVYTGDALLIHQIRQFLPGQRRIVMDLRYVWKEISVKEKCHEAGIPIPSFWREVDMLKDFIQGYVSGISAREIRHISSKSESPGHVYTQKIGENA